MFLTSLQLIDFRNFEREQLELSPSFNLFIGKNAQGKTNIIESLGLLATGRSFRTSEFRDMIRRERARATVATISCAAVGNDDLRVALDEGKKTFFRNGKRTVPGGFAGLRAVLFAPEEILLLRESPSERRRYIDRLISALESTYRGLARKYERVVGHRNRLLQDAAERRRVDAAALKSWDEQLIALGTKVVLCRARWSDELNSVIPDQYARIAPEDGLARFCYRPQCGHETVQKGEAEIKRFLQEGLQRRRADEIERGMTLVGPHRDDFEATISGRPVKQYGSQGQHRTFVVALKIAEIELLRRGHGVAPLLLLDDVASELDSDRSRFFFDYLKEVQGQIFVTATDADAIPLEASANAQLFFIEDGRARVRGRPSAS